MNKLSAYVLLLCLFNHVNAQTSVSGFDLYAENAQMFNWIVLPFNSNLSPNKWMEDKTNFDKTTKNTQLTNAQNSVLLQLKSVYDSVESKFLPLRAMVYSDSLILNDKNKSLIPINSNPDGIILRYSLSSALENSAYINCIVYDANKMAIGKADLNLENTDSNIQEVRLNFQYTSEQVAAYLSIEIGAGNSVLNSDPELELKINSIHLEQFTAMDLNNSNIGISVYPNPCSNFFVLKTDKDVSNYDVELVDMRGRILNVKADPTGVIACNNFTEGVYAVVVKGNGVVYNYKLVVRR